MPKIKSYTMRTLLCSLLFISLSTTLQAQTNQTKNDTLKNLDPVIITIKQQSPERMPEIKENVLFSGKKN